MQAQRRYGHPTASSTLPPRRKQCCIRLECGGGPAMAAKPAPMKGVEKWFDGAAPLPLVAVGRRSNIAGSPRYKYYEATDFGVHDQRRGDCALWWKTRRRGAALRFNPLRVRGCVQGSRPCSLREATPRKRLYFVLAYLMRYISPYQE